MNNTKRRVSCPQLTKLTLILTLLLGWGSQAWGDEKIFNSEDQVVTSGWAFTKVGYGGVITTGSLSSGTNYNLNNYNTSSGSEAWYTSTNKHKITSGQKFSIEAIKYGSGKVNGSIKVQYSSNGSDWVDSESFTASDYSNYTTFEDDNIVGEYYIRFEFLYVKIRKITLVDAPTVPTLSISPDADIELGKKWANAYEEVSITNNSGSTVNVVPSLDGTDAASFSITDDEDNDISAGSVNIDSESSMTFRIHYTYDSSSLGEKTATITFTPDEDSKNAITKNITLTAVSDNDPELSVSPNNDTNLGTVYSGEVEYTVTNTGTGSMTVNITSDNSDFVVSPTSISGLAYNESETFTVTYTFAETAEKIGTNSANITVTPTYDGGAAKNYEVSATSNATMTLDENNATTVNYGTKTYLHVKYTPSAGWNTISMPFTLHNSTMDNMDYIFGAGWKAYKLSSYNNGTLAFSKISASTVMNNLEPYLVYIESAPSHPSGVLLKDIYTSGNTPGSTTKGDATFQGTYSRKDYNAETDELTPWYGVVPSGQILKAGTDAYVKGYRAYFTGVTPPAGARLTIAIDDDGETTDLGFVKMVDPEAKDVYTLSGQKVEKAGKGIYIVNGRKVVIK